MNPKRLDEIRQHLSLPRPIGSEGEPTREELLAVIDGYERRGALLEECSWLTPASLTARIDAELGGDNEY